MSRIRILDDRLVSQIAAGEVVERPASVVKELVENAIDAGATVVQVDLEAGGKRRIVITDDGVGMDADDALLAFDRHATSKIADFGDLERVGTFGFRGEALSSIAAVARVELRTAAEPGEGQRVRIEGGRVRSVAPIAHPRGSRIEVASLFFNVPARRRFLKQTETELRHVLAVLQGYALAEPAVRFTVRHNGRAVLETHSAGEGASGLRERIGDLFGRDFARSLTPIEAPSLAMGESIEGFVGDPETARGRRSFVFVNRRLVRDRQVLAAYYRAVREVHKSDRTPALFLFMNLPPEHVDVNVHPQKAEVRFRDPRFPGRVEMALRATLETGRGEEAAPLRPPVSLPGPTAWEGLGGRAHGRDRFGASELRDGGSSESGGEWAVVETPAPSEIAGSPAGVPSPGIARPTFVPPSPSIVPLSGRSGEARPFRLLGQYKGSLILLEGPDGLYLIDQHVAHERILYERMRRTFAQESPSVQRLLEPVLLELSPAEAMRLEAMAEPLLACGIEIAGLSGGTVGLVAVPTLLDAEQAESLLHELATSDHDVEAAPDVLRDKLLDDLAADQSCKAAVKMHRPMGMAEMEALISELFEAEQPYACPHGRPIVLQMTDVELERRFGRR